MEKQPVAGRVVDSPSERLDRGSVRLPYDMLVLLVAIYLGWTLRATVLLRIDEAIANEWLRGSYSNLVKFVVWVLPAAAFVRFARQRSPLRYFGLTALPSARKWCFSLVSTAIFLGLIVIIDRLFSGKSLTLFDASVASVLAVVAAHMVSPVLEEILFRGFVLNELMAKLTFWRANVLTSFFFVLFHWPYHLWSEGPTANLAMMSVSLFAISVFLGWLYAVTNSLWPAIVAHVANNVLASFLVVSPG